MGGQRYEIDDFAEPFTPPLAPPLRGGEYQPDTCREFDPEQIKRRDAPVEPLKQVLGPAVCAIAEDGAIGAGAYLQLEAPLPRAIRAGVPCAIPQSPVYSRHLTRETLAQCG